MNKSKFQFTFAIENGHILESGASVAPTIFQFSKIAYQNCFKIYQDRSKIYQNCTNIYQNWSKICQNCSKIYQKYSDRDLSESQYYKGAYG